MREKAQLLQHIFIKASLPSLSLYLERDGPIMLPGSWYDTILRTFFMTMMGLESGPEKGPLNTRFLHLRPSEQCNSLLVRCMVIVVMVL